MSWIQINSFISEEKLNAKSKMNEAKLTFSLPIQLIIFYLHFSPKCTTVFFISIYEVTVSAFKLFVSGVFPVLSWNL